LRLAGRVSGWLIIDNPPVVKPDALSKKLLTNSTSAPVSLPKGLMYTYGIEPKKLSRIKPLTINIEACLRFIGPFSPIFVKKNPANERPTTAKNIPTIVELSPSVVPRKAGTTSNMPEN
jgi:hypothetical protein